jgi:pyrroline-5-carboxylate reductase
MKIGFLGTGHITSSVIEGIIKSKIKVKKIYISPRNRLISKKLSKKFKKVIISKNNQQLLDMSNWVFLAVTPKVGHKILKDLNFKKNHKIISFISTINIEKLMKYTKNKNITRVIPLPFIGIRKGPVVICPKDKSTSKFFKNLGKVIEIKNEKISKNFWTTSSFMAPFYNVLLAMSDWLVGRGVNRKSAEDYTRELFLALSQDSIFKNNLSLKQLVRESQTPGGINAQALRELKKKKFYKIQQTVLNSIFKRF